jgi:membrane associated rhomboid family serine protease
MTAPCNLLVILITCVISYLGFRSREVEEKYIFNPERILAGKEYYRLVSSSFLHAGWGHLFLNMVSLYSFGSVLELLYGRGEFLLIYFGAVIGGGLLSLFIHRHHHYFAYGASGGVCGIIFAHILLLPGSGVNLYFQVPVPGWLYAIGFLAGSFYAMREGRDNVGHDAHLGGAIVGLLIAAVLNPVITRYNWRIFVIVLVAAIALLVYLWNNPMLLPVSVFSGRGGSSKARRSELPRYKQQELEVDAVLEKIQKVGMDGLTEGEKALLAEASGKYQRRGDSQKPESDLII